MTSYLDKDDVPGSRRERPYEDEVIGEAISSTSIEALTQNITRNGGCDRFGIGLSQLYLEGVAEGRYLPSTAAIIEDHPESLTFGVQLMPIDAAAIGTINTVAVDPATRRHDLALVQRRVGQARFRESVLDAYASRCALCRLRHRELLDAVHMSHIRTVGLTR